MIWLPSNMSIDTDTQGRPLPPVAPFLVRRSFEGTHRQLRRCRTSAQGAACTCPARNSARRRFTSARQRSETVASSAVSRLSRRATAKAERSSTGRPRTSSSRWSTRAFMRFSLAPRVPCGKRSTDNMSIDPDTQLPHLRRAVVCRSSSR
jgi:hypothetical protein